MRSGVPLVGFAYDGAGGRAKKTSRTQETKRRCISTWTTWARWMPQTDGNGNSIYPEKVNVLCSSQGGSDVTMGQVGDAAACTDQVRGWYYE